MSGFMYENYSYQTSHRRNFESEPASEYYVFNPPHMNDDELLEIAIALSTSPEETPQTPPDNQWDAVYESTGQRKRDNPIPRAIKSLPSFTGCSPASDWTSASLEGVAEQSVEPLSCDVLACKDCSSQLDFSSWYKHSKSEGLLPHLHVFCSRCNETKCRGCRSTINCQDPHCTGSSASCQILNHCSAVRTVALYEVLQCFDDHYLDTFSGVGDRQAYLARSLKHFSDPLRRWEKYTVVILNWLLVILEAIRLNEDMDVSGLNRTSSSLFEQSFIIDLFSHILSTNYDVRDWNSHYHLFISVLRVMTSLHSTGLEDLFSCRLPCTDRWNQPLRNRLLLDDAQQCYEHLQPSLFHDVTALTNTKDRLFALLKARDRRAPPGKSRTEEKTTDLLHEINILLLERITC